MKIFNIFLYSTVAHEKYIVKWGKKQTLQNWDKKRPCNSKEKYN